MTSPGGPPRSVVRSFVGTGPTLWFHGHYDVVPAQHAGQFAPEVRDGMLFGRGSADMKGGLAAMILAAQAIRERGVALGGRLGLVFVPDEETGGAGGSAALARAGLLGEDGIGMLSPEPTGGIAWNACRGAISLRVTVHGRSAHVGLSHSGVNAFTHMLDVASALRDLATRGRRAPHRLRHRARRGAQLHPPARRPGGVGRQLQRRARPVLVHRRPPHQPRGGPRRGARPAARPARAPARRGPRHRGRDPPGGARGRRLGRHRPRPGARAPRSPPSRAPTCGSRCAPACSRSASMRASGCRRTATGRAGSRCRTGPTSTWRSTRSSGAPRCTR